MNAAQRRKHRREHPYEVTIYTEEGRPWNHHDDVVMSAKRWCGKQFKDRWTTDAYWDYTVFKFVRESDAVLFGLKWA